MKLIILIITALYAVSGCSGKSSEPTDDKEPIKTVVEVPEIDCTTPPVAPAQESQMRLLTRYEYDFTVRDLFGVDANYARDLFPVENASEGFESTSEHGVSDSMLRKLVDAAELISPQATWNTGTGIPELLSRAFRRPATQEEIDRFQGLLVSASQEWGPIRAKEMVIEAVLVSPQFLYRVEFEDEGAAGTRIANNGYETASRLSYFLWGTMPDQALFDAAQAGELKTPAQLEAQVIRMLADDKAKDLVHEFYRQYLGLNALETAVRDRGMFPLFSSEMVADYMESSRRFFEDAHFGENGGNIRTLLTSDKLHITPDLARVLMEEEGEISKPGERAGLMTHPALMLLLSYPDQTSPIHRGIFVRERILCQELPPPPNNITIEPPPFDPTVSTRERFEQLTEADFCTSCHVRIDPLGFGFENYDPVGRYRSTDAGKNVDGTGSLTFTHDPTLAGSFDGAVELAERLADAPEVKACIAEQWFRFAQGQRPGKEDYCEVHETVNGFAKTEGSFQDLMVSIVSSETFRHRLLQGTGQ